MYCYLAKLVLKNPLGSSNDPSLSMLQNYVLTNHAIKRCVPDFNYKLCISGKVYNITPYLDFHPGGEDELLRGAGIDGTALFDEVLMKKLDCHTEMHLSFQSQHCQSVVHLSF